MHVAHWEHVSAPAINFLKQLQNPTSHACCADFKVNFLSCTEFHRRVQLYDLPNKGCSNHAGRVVGI
jgi:hypothetical protein